MVSTGKRVCIGAGLAALTGVILLGGRAHGPLGDPELAIGAELAPEAVASPSQKTAVARLGDEGARETGAFEQLGEYRFPAPSTDQNATNSEEQAAVLTDAFEKLLGGDYENARFAAAPLAEAGNADAQHLLGFLYEKGLGVDANIGKAQALYGDAAQAGNVDAILALGDLALKGGSVKRDFKQAAAWYERGVEKGDPRAQARLGSIYAEGLLGKRNVKKALALFERAAAKNDPEGHYALGLAYLNGDGKELDYNLAADHFEKAATRGHGPASYNLALLHDSPYLGEPDAKKAFDYLKMAADIGYPQAMTALGLFAHRGDAPGAPADWFERAARAGDPQGKFLLAVSHAKGDGRDENPDIAQQLAREVLDDPLAEDMLKANARQLLASLDAEKRKLTFRD